jgi:SAM-dependent methyltransferase
VAAPPAVGSASIAQPEYWWYQARAALLHTAFGPVLEADRAEPGSGRVGPVALRVLDVGSADGPSVGWLRSRAGHVSLDIDIRGLSKGDVCGSAMALPFADGSFDLVAAFDVVEHCEPESAVLAEIVRVLAPGGRLLMSVPAYTWAWTHFDEVNGHHRRYTRGRAVRAVEAQGLEVLRATYAFASVFPIFTAGRLAGRLRQALSRRKAELQPGEVPPLPVVSPLVHRFLIALCSVDQRLLARHDLPFGSSVLVAAGKPR